MADVKALYRDMASVLDKHATPPLLDDFSPFRPAINEIWEQVEKVDDKTFQTSSPWHAAIVTMDLMASLASKEPLDETKAHITNWSQLEGKLPAMHYAFRGEGNCKKSLCPSYYRSYNENRRPELRRAISNFAAMLKFASDLCFTNDRGPQNLDINIFGGAAQHYVGNTPLMDWTTDPCVAVGFGANYAPKEEFSVVYAIPMVSAVQHNATFYLPPPFVERLYLQRGFFIETRERKDDIALQEACVRILFKEDNAFKVFRGGTEVADLMKPLPVLDALAQHAKQKAAKGIEFTMGATDVGKLQEKLKNEWDKIGGIPEFLQASAGEEHAESWRKYLIDMIERFSHLKTKSGLKVNKFVLKPIVCSNRIMMSALQQWSEIQEKWAREEIKNDQAARGWGDLAALLKELLSQC